MPDTNQNHKFHSPIGAEDYLEPACLLGGAPMGQPEPPRPVDVRRVAEKLDAYCARRDFAGAERHLDYWLAEARFIGDKRGELALQNERMGFFRKQGREAEAVDAALAAADLVPVTAGEDSVSAATCYVNVGTVYDSFDRPAEALPWFEKALPLYELLLPEGDSRRGGLYNNMGLALAGLERWEEARKRFQMALTAMEGTRYGPWEQAITCLNMADAEAAEKGPEASEAEVQALLERACALLDDERTPRNVYYAFVCEKCAPGLLYHGWFAYGEELKERSEAYYDRT